MQIISKTFHFATRSTIEFWNRWWCHAFWTNFVLSFSLFVVYFKMEFSRKKEEKKRARNKTIYANINWTFAYEFICTSVPRRLQETVCERKEIEEKETTDWNVSNETNKTAAAAAAIDWAVVQKKSNTCLRFVHNLQILFMHIYYRSAVRLSSYQFAITMKQKSILCSLRRICKTSEWVSEQTNDRFWVAALDKH